MPQNRKMPLFSAQSLKFLRDLKKHNDREWFQPRKPLYDQLVKAPMLELIETVNRELVQVAPAFVTEPKKAIFRIYRDTRFAHDKTPYKTNTSAVFWQEGVDRKGGAVLYISLSADEIIVAGGSYMPTPPEMLALRQHLAEHHARFTKLLSSKPLQACFGELQGQSLQRAPKGFSPSHEAVEFLKRKQWLLRTSLDPRLAITDAFVSDVIKRMRLLLPFVNFMNEPLVKRAARVRDPLLATRM